MPGRAMGLARLALVGMLAAAEAAPAQLSTQSVRTFGAQTQTDDSIRLPIEGQPADVGAGAFTVEQWLRCTDAANPPVGGTARAGDTETATVDWVFGRVFLDRDIFDAPAAGGGDWGASLYPVADDPGRTAVRFGAERSGALLTIQGSVDVCDDGWHHVAVGRDGANRLFLHVDGVEDYRSDATISGDLSYPTGTGSGQDPFLVWGNEKHAVQVGYVGWLDELRVWNVARSAAQVDAARFTALAGDTPGLVLYLRLEEGDRAANPEPLVDATGGNTGIVLHDGVAGNGAWSTSVPAGGTGTTSTTSTTTSSTGAPGGPTTTSSTATSTTAPPGGSSSSTAPPAPSTSSTAPPGASTTTTSSPGPPTTTTTLGAPCATAVDCDDGDPCTTDACAGRCTHAPPAGLAGAACEVGRLAAGPLCPADPVPARLARAVGRRLGAAVRLLEAAAVAGPESRRGRRRIAAVSTKLRAAEKRIARAAARERVSAPCGAALLGALGRAAAALAPLVPARAATAGTPR
jgi:hypothetical protein